MILKHETNKIFKMASLVLAIILLSFASLHLLSPRSRYSADEDSVVVANIGSSSVHVLRTGVLGTFSVGNLDADPAMEVVAFDPDTGLYCIDGSSGAIQWQKSLASFGNAHPSIADIDADGALDIVVPVSGTEVRGIYGINGTTRWTTPLHVKYTLCQAIGDVDGDGNDEVVIGTDNNTLCCLNGYNGSIEWNSLLPELASIQPVIGDLDGDGKMEIVVSSNNKSVYCATASTDLSCGSSPPAT
jgi:outer membrane protein assembly factor BamB